MSASPPGFRVVLAPRTEQLFDALVEAIREPLADPAARECIVVQSRGMERWLELHLATRFGVWANPWFPFPEEFAYRLWRELAPGTSPGRRGVYEREGLTWNVAAALPALLDEPDFQPLREWLGKAREPARALALAKRIGGVLYGYMLSRPELLLRWEDQPDESPLPPGLPPAAAEDAAWQAVLWRAVVDRAGPDHPARRARQIEDALRAEPASTQRLRRRFGRVSVFGLSALSPLYVRILAALGRHLPVHHYALAASPADARRVAEGVRAKGWGPDTIVPESGIEEVLADLRPVHPMVEDQAGAARAFQMLVAMQGAELSIADEAASAAPSSLLERLQSDIALGREPSPCPEALRAFTEGRDQSIGLHSCHGPLREVEVLRDQLLDAFDRIEGLAPQDVVVMVPDLEAYAPYVEAVFGTGRAEDQAIPFQVADRPPRADRPGAMAFLRALHVLRGRMTAPELLDLLSIAPVRAARGLDEEAIETIRAWIEASGIRWGLDAAHRASVGQPALEANTWRWGLTRLVLGWAAPGDGRGRFHESLPLPAAGAEPALLGALAGFWDFLGRWRAEILDARLPVAEWLPRLSGMLAELIGEGAASEEDRLLVEAALGRLAERVEAAGYGDALGLDAMGQLLESALGEDPPPRGYLEGAVTVCGLQPMRAVPFRVLALVGMNDGAFPRSDRPAGFDLAARQPRLGDSLQRDADRLLFFEAIACARDRLIVTWTGQDSRTDLGLPPSVVVSELVDVLGRMGGRPAEPPEPEQAAAEGPDSTPGAAASPRPLVLKHPLQPFSPRYFGADPDGDPRLFSYGAAFARSAGAASATRRGRPSLVAHPLPALAPPDPPRLVPIDALARFPEAPARRLLRDRLGIAPPLRRDPLSDREPMRLEALDSYHVGEAILAARLAGADPDEALAIAAAEGRLPLGTPGRLAVAPVRAVADGLVAVSEPLRRGGGARAEAIALAFPALEIEIGGALEGLWPAGRLELHYGRLDLRRELRLWLRHLALNVALAEGALTDCAPVSWAIGRGPKDPVALLRFGPVPDARARLARILERWLEAENALLPFFPHAARAFVDALRTEEEGAAAGPGPPGSDPDALAAARRKAADAFGAGRREAEPQDGWSGHTDLDDAFLSLALGDALPWDEDGQVVDAAMVARFESLALEILGPLDAAATRVKGEQGARALLAEALA